MPLSQQTIGKVFSLFYQARQLFVGKRLLQNVIYNSGAFFLIAVINFVSLPLFIAKLGVEAYGIYVLVTSLFGYYGIFDLGIGQGLIKFVSERAQSTKQIELVSGIRSAFWIQFIIGFFVSFLLFYFSLEISSWLNVGEKNLVGTSKIIKIAALGFLFSSISITFSSALMGLQLYRVTAKVDAIYNLAVNAISLAFLYFLPQTNLSVLIFVTVALAFISALFYYTVLCKKIKGFNLQFELNRTLLFEFFKFSIHIFFSKLSNLFASYIVKFVIGFYAGPAAVTYFTVPSKLVGAFGGLMSSAANTLMPYISALKVNADHQKILKTSTIVSFIFSAVSIPVALYIAVFSKQILYVWMGADFSSNSWLILSITCISATVGSFSTIPNQVIIGMGNSKLLGYFSLLTIVFYCLFLPAFTKYYNLIGASVALLLTSVLLIVFVIRKTTSYLKIPTWQYVKDVFVPHLLPVLFFLGGSYLIINSISGSYIIQLFLGLGLIVMYYFYLFLTQKQFFLNIIS